MFHGVKQHAYERTAPTVSLQLRQAVPHSICTVMSSYRRIRRALRSRFARPAALCASAASDGVGLVALSK